jgi:hypothetical protein
LRCCAREANGHAAAVPPRSVMNSRRFIIEDFRLFASAQSAVIEG